MLPEITHCGVTSFQPGTDAGERTLNKSSNPSHLFSTLNLDQDPVESAPAFFCPEDGDREEGDAQDAELTGPRYITNIIKTNLNRMLDT
jgi:hypothetical protein